MPASAQSFVPTAAVAAQAGKGLKLRAKHKRGGTAVGVARARDLKNRKALSAATVKRMYSYFQRHSVDKKGKDFFNKENPSAGYIAWLLWGGDAGRKWAEAKKKKLDA